MKLETFRETKGLSVAALGRLIKKCRVTTHRYLSGETRPQKDSDYREIFIATGGRTTPNDFYEIATWKTELQSKK